MLLLVRIHLASKLTRVVMHGLEALTKLVLKSNLHWILDGRKRVVSPQRMLREANINTLARQRACDNCPRASLLSVHHSSKWHSNIKTEKRSTKQTTRSVFEKLLVSQNWLSNQKSINHHPMLSYLRQGKKKEFGWLQKEEAKDSKKTMKTGKHV
jgi:hypothetical protein